MKRFLHVHCPAGELDGREVNFTLTVIVTDTQATWLINGVPIIALHSSGLIANEMVLDAIAGLPVKAQIPVDRAFEGIYTIPVETHAA